MTTAIDIKPQPNEFPSHFADRIGQFYTKTVTTQHKKDNGQFFTPTEIAHFMAGLTKQIKDKFKILDPGCGTIRSLAELLLNNERHLSLTRLK